MKADVSKPKLSRALTSRAQEHAHLIAELRCSRRRNLLLEREKKDAPRIATGVAVLDRLESDARGIEIESTKFGEDAKGRMLRISRGQANARRGLTRITKDPAFNFDTGWLDPKGCYYGCELGEHIELSQQLAETIYPKSGSANGERVLETKGWVKCTGAVWLWGETKLTQKQIDTLYDWAKKWAKDGNINLNGRPRTLQEIIEKGA